MNTELIAAIVGGAFGLICAVIGVCGTLIVTARTARIEERRHFRELGLKVALTNFEHCMALAQSAADKYNETFQVPPLKAFVIQGIKLMEIISESNISAQEMAKRIADSEDFTQTIIRAAQKKAENANPNAK
jgi:hypothetical protein